MHHFLNLMCMLSERISFWPVRSGYTSGPDMYDAMTNRPCFFPPQSFFLGAISLYFYTSKYFSSLGLFDPGPIIFFPTVRTPPN